ncbi:unnamed protein product [Musa acuminata subsp. burmannicoides]
MHLWPSLRIRDSFKQAYLDKIERNLHRMQQHKQRLRGERSSYPLLANSSSDGDAGSSSSKDRLQHETLSPLRFCSDILFVLSCCCCCFCCGACIDEKENQTPH